MTKSVPQALADLGALFEERNALYKNNYFHFGEVLTGMFPEGLTLKTAEEFNRFALFLQIVHKSTRYANAMLSGGHADSCDDTSVYSQMLREFDGVMAEQKLKGTYSCKLEPLDLVNDLVDPRL